MKLEMLPQINGISLLIILYNCRYDKTNGRNDTSESEELLQLPSSRDQQSVRWGYN